MQRIKALVKEPGQSWRLREIDNTLEAFQQIVGGYIEQITLDDNVILIVNEEGKLRGLAPNFMIPGDMVVGTAIMTYSKSDEFEDIPNIDDIEAALDRGESIFLAARIGGKMSALGILEGEKTCKTKKS